jgi:energy-coupling factor transporter ATP-binding protein EcfA2
MKIELEVPVRRTGRVMQVEGMFDVPQAERQGYSLEVPAEFERVAAMSEGWDIGLIVGPSGAGKSAVLRQFFGAAVSHPYDMWDDEAALIDQLGGNVREATAFLTAVGLGSPPAWLKPFHALSNGEQFRAGIARALANPDAELIALDEFTSVVDRTVAQVASHATQKAVRRAGLRLVAASCHFDIIDWLAPDWVYRPDTGSFEQFPRGSLQRPPVELQIAEVPRDAWPPFSRHHYLSSHLHVAAHSYGAFLGDECIAFNSHIPFPHPKTKNIRMGHRLVVLPDYQGLGIGLAFDNWLGERLHARGYRYHKTISHPALIHAYAGSPRWEMLQNRNRPTRGGAKRLHKTMRTSRKLATRSFRYVPVQNGAGAAAGGVEGVRAASPP